VSNVLSSYVSSAFGDQLRAPLTLESKLVALYSLATCAAADVAAEIETRLWAECCLYQACRPIRL